ncbi:MAG: hypothetical protein LBS77_07290 [Desulfovibrio sp.]|nr:hypothetical protein [Desulfovibrio sp.]
MATQKNDEDIIELTELIAMGDNNISEDPYAEKKADPQSTDNATGTKVELDDILSVFGEINLPQETPPAGEEDHAALADVSARLDDLESRLSALANQFEANMEQAAAGAVAKILREEIAKLLTS